MTRLSAQIPFDAQAGPDRRFDRSSFRAEH